MGIHAVSSNANAQTPCRLVKNVQKRKSYIRLHNKTTSAMHDSPVVDAGGDASSCEKYAANAWFSASLEQSTGIQNSARTNCQTVFSPQAETTARHPIEQH